MVRLELKAGVGDDNKKEVGVSTTEDPGVPNIRLLSLRIYLWQRGLPVVRLISAC